MMGNSVASNGVGWTIIAAWTPSKTPCSRRTILPPPPSSAGGPRTVTVSPASCGPCPSGTASRGSLRPVERRGEGLEQRLVVREHPALAQPAKVARPPGLDPADPVELGARLLQPARAREDRRSPERELVLLR